MNEQATRERLSPELRRKNLRLALALGAFALFVFITSIPYWEAILSAIGNSAGQ